MQDHPQPPGQEEPRNLAAESPSPRDLLVPRTHKDHSCLSILRDLLQKLQFMLGLGASDAGWWGLRWQLTLDGWWGREVSPHRLAHGPAQAPPLLSSHLSFHLQSGLWNASDERLGDVRVALGPLTMVMAQQGAQGASRDIAGEGEILLVTWVAGGGAGDRRGSELRQKGW